MSREQILCVLLLFCVVNTVSIQSQLSLGRANLAATATSKGRELAFFGGGNYGTNTYSNVDVFDNLGNLINTTYLSVARLYLAATSVGELAMFGGGSDTNGVIYDTIDVYNATSMNTNIMKLSVPRFLLSATSSADLAFFAGGASGVVTVRVVDIYNVTSQKWIHTNLSEARGNIAATSVGELVFFAGGSSDRYHDAVDIYNVTLGDWLPVEHLSEARWGAAAASVGHLAIFAGGISASGFSDVVDIYDSITGKWSVAKLSAKRGYMAATTIGDLVFFGGGAYGNYLYTGVVDIYDYSNDEWNSTLMSQPRGSYAAATVGQLALFGGGFTQLRNNVGVTSMVDIYAYCNNITFTYEVNVCDPVIPLNPAQSHSEHKPSPIKIYIIVGSVVGAFLLINVSIAIFIRRVYKKRKLQYIEIPTVPPIPMIKDITVMERLGGGQFGEVYRGIVQKTSIVALKKLISGDHLSEFEREASVLCTLNHPNIVRFYGIHIGPNKENYIVTEYLSDGSLDRLLQLKSDEISIYDLLYMCQHVIAGMSYLKDNRVVHRDLALRNLLVTRDENGKYVVKVADFGMSRLINKGYYKTDDKTIPIKWSAPEFIEFGTCTYKSDVWSFGVCLWEMFSYGRLPYPGMTNRQVIDNVLGGYRMEIPNGCPVEVYNVMMACWNKDPQNRPNFEELAQSLEECSVLYRRNESQVADLESLNYVVDDVVGNHYN